MKIPSEVISKIMLFHSNICFEKKELVYFVEKWSLVKYLDEPEYPSQEDWNIIKELCENKTILRFYTRWTHHENFGEYSRLDRAMDNLDY